MLKKNSNFKELANIAKILSGEPEDEGDKTSLPKDPAVLTSFANAPITAVDVERFISSPKGLLSFMRLNLTEDHVRNQMQLQWNKVLTGEL